MGFCMCQFLALFIHRFKFECLCAVNKMLWILSGVRKSLSVTLFV